MLPYITAASGVFAASAVLYSKIRPRFSVKVNCWFCQTKLKVPFESQNSWECPHCEQYNGFTEDGDYNRVLPAQRNEELNPCVIPQKANSSRPPSSNGFCSTCTLNQQLKIQQLSSFTPLKEEYYDQEVEAYQAHLERTYKLCLPCQALLESKLDEESHWLKKNLLAAQLEKVKSAAQRMKVSYHSTTFRKIVCHIHWTVLLTAFVADALSAGAISPVVPWAVLHLETQKQQDVMLLGFILSVLCAFFPSSEKCSSRMWILPILWIFKYSISAHFLASATSAIVQSSALCVASLASLVLNLEKLPFSTAEHKTKPLSARNLSSPSKEREIPPPPSPSIQPWDSASQLTVNRLKDSMSEVLEEDDQEDDLDTSIDSLRIGPKTVPGKQSHIFVPQPYSKSPKKSVLSPSRLGALPITQASWVAGGYFQAPLKPAYNAKTQIGPLNHVNAAPPCTLSRSSSQSSGFVSHGSEHGKSSKRGFTGNSLPGSRASSVCGDLDRFSVLSEPVHTVSKPSTSKVGSRDSFSLKTNAMAMWRTPDTVLREGDELRIPSSVQEFSDSEDNSAEVLRPPTVVNYGNCSHSMVSTTTMKSVENPAVKQANWVWLPFFLGFSVAVNLCAVMIFLFARQLLQ